ncbi:MAG: phytoene/squalene synthase family protein [Thermodesulfobacteriota bacterium]|nr:phytoene/squalene synthase family protein [Thermodesulfobacteriota bacterium]
MNKKLIESGFSQAKHITKRHSKTFYFASHFLGADKRKAAYSVYSICRIADDSVDNALVGNSDVSSQKKLDHISHKINLSYSSSPLDDPLLMAFRETVHTYQIPKTYFDELLLGMHMDLEKFHYTHFQELYDYCYKVAGVVGLIMLQIFGYTDINAQKYAINLGIAMQLTNILRDIQEDFIMGRIYLPEDEMQKFRIVKDNIKYEKVDSNFIAFMKFQIQRARDYYSESSKGNKMIHDKRSRFVVCAMGEIYSAILKAIEKNQYDVFSQRAHTSKLDKLKLLTKVVLEGKYKRNESILKKHLKV